jgi:hypothetical protein
MKSDNSRTDRTESVTEALHVPPIEGESTAEIAAFDRSLHLVVKRARAVDGAHHEGMWRTWKLQGVADAEVDARAAASLALSTIPADRPELRALVEQRCAGLETFLARYPGRKPL